MSRSSELFNQLPFETRRIASLSHFEMQIRQIRSDQMKAKAAYAKFMNETNDHIKTLTKHHEQLLKEVESDVTPE